MKNVEGKIEILLQKNLNNQHCRHTIHIHGDKSTHTSVTIKRQNNNQGNRS